MSLNRIQKLLFSEYSDFEDVVLVESPFAETTREGKGIQQIQIGLTPTKLILAAEVIQSANKADVLFHSKLDLYVKNFEFISVFPIQCVNLSVFHRRARHTLKAHFCNNQIRYFELGGIENSEMLWNLWCERVRFLSPDDPGSSYSETSVASSESNSTIYLTASTKVAIPDLGVPQIWCQYKADKHRHEEIGTNRTPYGDMICHPKPGNSMTEVRMLYRKPQINKRCSNSCTSCTTSETPTLSEGSQLQLVNRFGCGIPENCITALYLPEEKYTVERKTNQHVSHVAESIELVTVYPPNHQLPSMSNLLEESISLWEKTKRQREVNNDKLRHPRYYGFSSHCLFLNGLGPWHVAPGEKHSIQAKGAVSSVTICRQPADSEMRLPVSKRQLSSSISCDALHMSNHCLSNSLKKPKPPSQSMVYFWTPKYWYRPISSKAAYRELNRHMKEIHRYHEQNAMIQAGKRKRKSRFGRPCKIRYMEKSGEKIDLLKIGNSSQYRQTGDYYKPEDSTISQLHKMLRLEILLTAWDFDSSTLAYQITLIDKELFLKIPEAEIGVLAWQLSSKNAPCIAALIAFSHRISCLITTEIMREESIMVRARLITRFINVADKCNRLQNFQSCRSVLAGLQSLPVYRLDRTWAYVRQHHAIKYHVFGKLCKIYRDPRLPVFQKIFQKATLSPPYLPYIGDFLAKLLGRVPESSFLMDPIPGNVYKDKDFINSPYEHMNNLHLTKNVNPLSRMNSMPNIIRRFLSAFRIWPSYPMNSLSNDSFERQALNKRKKKNKHKGNMNSGVSCVNEIPSFNLLNNLQAVFESVSPIEDLTVRRYQSISLLLQKSQIAASNYALCQNNLAREFLLKARYQEERENFFHSFYLEPRHENKRKNKYELY